VVDEIALADALNVGKLSGAALDVLATEPMSAECPLIGAKNLTLTPHVAWIPVETRQRLIGIVADNLKAFLEGTPKNKVN
jgi:glycerate dehydrogenase